MSHFTVLVIGEDVEGQLQPYHEFECTGTEDEYIKIIDITEKARKIYESEETMQSFAAWAEEYYGLKTVSFGESVDLEGKHKYGFITLSDTREVVKIYDRTNPESRWDWWSLGGRWTGFFRLKPGARGVLGDPGLGTVPGSPGTADQARKGEIDFLAMQVEAEKEAGERWDKAQQIIAGRTWETWEEVKARIPEIEQAREVYHRQPVIQDFQRTEDFWWDTFDELRISRSEYISRAAKQAYVTFAVVKNGKWFERGKMGWFGCVSEEKPEEIWEETFWSLLEDVSDETLLSLVDAHI